MYKKNYKKRYQTIKIIVQKENCTKDKNKVDVYMFIVLIYFQDVHIENRYVLYITVFINKETGKYLTDLPIVNITYFRFGSPVKKMIKAIP